MFKKDGKEYYTFTGFLNRFDACNSCDNNFTEKDIPPVVTFKGVPYYLTDDRSSYISSNTNGHCTLARDVAEIYGDDILKYLNNHDFVVDPKYSRSPKLTGTEKRFIRMCLECIRDRREVKYIGIPTGSPRMIMFLGENRVRPNAKTNLSSFYINDYVFCSLVPGEFYKISDLTIYD